VRFKSYLFVEKEAFLEDVVKQKAKNMIVVGSTGAILSVSSRRQIRCFIAVSVSCVQFMFKYTVLTY